jgi:cysteine-rich repeat protein
MKIRNGLCLVVGLAACGDNREVAVGPDPGITSLSASVAEDGSLTFEIPLASGDADSMLFEASDPGHGTVTNTGPSFTYMPASHYVGADGFRVTIENEGGEAHVSVSIKVIADMPKLCGNGTVDLSAGETCDDGNTVDGDGCDSMCQVEPFETVAPVLISSDLTCTTATANAARKVAVDTRGTIFAVMSCDGAPMFVVSKDRGKTYSDPAALPFATTADPPVTTVSTIAIASGPVGVAYAAAIMTTGDVQFSTTADSGATWSAPQTLGTGSASAGLSLQSFNDDVYLGFSHAGIQVARNHARGVGAFDMTSVAMSVVFFDLMYDVAAGSLVIGADTPTFHVRASSDQGVTFATEVNPPGSEFFSDWTIGNGHIYVSGTSGASSLMMYDIPVSALDTSTTVGALPMVSTSQNRTMTADAAGNAYAGSTLDAGGVQLDRFVFGASAFDATPRAISATGSSPIPAPLPGSQGAALVYTDGTSVFATVQAEY